MKTRWCFGLDDFKIPSKSNTNQIFFNPNLWNQIKDIVGRFRKAMPWKKTRGTNPYWIGPTKETQVAQATIAWNAKEFVRKTLTGPIEVRIDAYGANDVDNLAKIILDGLQDSKRIGNDRQVKILHVERDYNRKGSGFTVEVIEL